MELWAILPELTVAALALALVPVAGWARGRWQNLPQLLAALGLLVGIGLTARMLPWEPVAVFEGTYAVDGFAHVFKLILLTGALITLLTLWGYFRGHPMRAQAPVALLLSTLGGMGLTSALDLALILLFLQLLSLASYLLVALVQSDPAGNEATLKYFLYAAVALAVMAYGLTFFYGLTGSLALREIGAALRSGGSGSWLVVAAGLVLIGYAFEATLVPFHFWAPDVYQGATAPVAGFLSVVPKTAALAGLLRFALTALPGGLAAWPQTIAGIAVVTMLWGNLAALRQSRLKRLLAYSSIAQAGYVLLALAVADRTPGALTAVAFYLATYLFMNLGAFAVAAQMERTLGHDQIASLDGWGRAAPLSAAVLTLCLLSLGGIPPLAGFFGKVLLFQAAIDGGLLWLAIIGAANMALAIFYYLAPVARIYLRPPAGEIRVPAAWEFTAAFILCLGGVFWLGIFPESPLRILRQVSSLLP